jgi:hypothetical protein
LKEKRKGIIIEDEDIVEFEIAMNDVMLSEEL